MHDETSLTAIERPAAAYTALIRTHDSHPVVEAAVRALRAQSFPPARIVAVDSRSRPEQRLALEKLVDQIVDYPDDAFNYAKAINIGIPMCTTPYVLVISSHVVLDDPRSIQRAFTEFESARAFAFYLHHDPEVSWASRIVRRAQFDGHNGLHNTCAFLSTAAVAARPFREEVFSAEDQEWAAHHFRAHDVAILRVGTRALRSLNARTNTLKFVNEEIAIAYFVCREKLGAVHLVMWLARSVLAFVRGRPGRSRAHLTIFRELVRARFRPPRRQSRYY